MKNNHQDSQQLCLVNLLSNWPSSLTPSANGAGLTDPSPREGNQCVIASWRKVIIPSTVKTLGATLGMWIL